MSTKKPLIIFWFRRDLRLGDNHGLAEALKAAKARQFSVLPIFIFDKTILKNLPKNDARVSFIADCLQQMQAELAEENKAFQVFHGEPQAIFEQLIEQHDIRAVFCNHDYEPQAMQRDLAVKAMLNERGVAFRHFADQVIFEKDQVLKNDGKPYTVFTPYKKRWLQKFSAENDTFAYGTDWSTFATRDDYPAIILSLSDIGFTRSSINVQPYDFGGLNNYQIERDYPACNATSHLSVHLRFGTISVRQAMKKALSVNDTLVSELIWREFFMQILWHFPHVVKQSFRPAYDNIQWRNNDKEFQAWCEGKTGYPLVDAGMRELNQTGYMHNRVRMVVASFLCKHLLIDWRWGEAYFAEKLLDFELSANNGNWQWAAGSGCDAAPYFRIFNPATQAKKFDAENIYIQRYVPEFNTSNYPEPIVEHKMARERCLLAYSQAVLKSKIKE